MVERGAQQAFSQQGRKVTKEHVILNEDGDGEHQSATSIVKERISSPYQLRPRSIANSASPALRKNKKRSSASPKAFPAFVASPSRARAELVRVSHGGMNYVFQPLEIPPESPMPFNLTAEIKKSDLLGGSTNDTRTLNLNPTDYVPMKMNSVQKEFEIPNFDSLIANDVTVGIPQLQELQNTFESALTIGSLLDEDNTVNAPIPLINNLVEDDHTVTLQPLPKLNALIDSDETVAFSHSTFSLESANVATPPRGKIEVLIDDDETSAFLPSFLEKSIQSLVEDDRTRVLSFPSNSQGLEAERTFNPFKVIEIQSLVDEDATISLPNYNPKLTDSDASNVQSFEANPIEIVNCIRPQALRIAAPTSFVKPSRMSVAMEIDSPVYSSQIGRNVERLQVSPSSLETLIDQDQTICDILQIPIKTASLAQAELSQADHEASINTSAVSLQSTTSTEGSPSLPVPALNHGPSLLVSRSTWEEDQERKLALQRQETSPLIKASKDASPGFVFKTIPMKTPISHVVQTFQLASAQKTGITPSPYTHMLNSYNELVQQSKDIPKQSALKSAVILNDASISVSLAPIQLLSQMNEDSFLAKTKMPFASGTDSIHWNHSSLLDLNVPKNNIAPIEKITDTASTVDVRAQLMQADFAKILFGKLGSGDETNNITRNLTQTVNLDQLSDQTRALLLSQAKILLEEDGNEAEVQVALDKILNKRVSGIENVEESGAVQLSEELINFMVNFGIQFSEPAAISSTRQSSVNGFVQRDHLEMVQNEQEEMKVVLTLQPELDMYENAVYEMQQKIENLKISVAEAFESLSLHSSPLLKAWMVIKKEGHEYQMFDFIIREYISKFQVETQNEWFGFKEKHDITFMKTLMDERDQCNRDLRMMEKLLQQTNSPIAAVPLVTSSSFPQTKLLRSKIVDAETEIQGIISKLDALGKMKGDISLDLVEDIEVDLEFFIALSPWKILKSSRDSKELLFENLFLVKVKIGQALIWEIQIITKSLESMPIVSNEFLRRLLELNLSESSLSNSPSLINKSLRQIEIVLGRIMDLVQEIGKLSKDFLVTTNVASTFFEDTMPSVSVTIIATSSAASLIRMEFGICSSYQRGPLSVQSFINGPARACISSAVISRQAASLSGFRKISQLCNFVHQQLLLSK